MKVKKDVVYFFYKNQKILFEAGCFNKIWASFVLNFIDKQNDTN